MLPYGCHSHYFGDITSIDHGHIHEYSGITSCNPDVPGHVHYVYGETTLDNGHIHYYNTLTDPTIEIGGGHIHYYEAATSFNNGHIHYTRATQEWRYSLFPLRIYTMVLRGRTNMPTDFELDEWDKIASVIYIIGSVIAIITANKAEQILIQKQNNSEAPTNAQSDVAPLTVSQLVVIIGVIYVIGNVIYGQASFFRLEKLEKDIAAGTETGSDVPDKLIAFGWVFGIVGSLIRLAGAQLRLEEEKSGNA